MTGIGNAVNGPEAAPYLAKAGGTMTGNLILNTNTPTTSLQAASKGYVDAVAADLNVLPAVTAATTTALTATYNNVSAPPSGVGATLTNAGAFAVFSIDGVTPAVGKRVLIKNQAAQLQNGIYTVTVAGDAVSVNWVLTRATDYDEVIEINPSDVVFVNNGGQKATAWMQTAVVTSVGVDPIIWSQFGQGTVTSLVAGTGITLTPGPIISSGTISLTTPAITQVNIITFPSTGTYTPTTGMISCQIECVGGGGGGGAVAVGAGTTAAASGGGGGGYSKGVYTKAQIIGAGSAATVTIGGGGAGGAAGANNGVQGGTSSVVANSGGGATLIQATGGLGGLAANGLAAGTGTGGVVGGVGSLGSLNSNGGGSGGGVTLAFSADTGFGGSGGNSFYGGGAPSTTVNNAGSAGTAFGGGGGGACSDAGAGNKAGGNGFAGVVCITEYLTV